MQIRTLKTVLAGVLICSGCQTPVFESAQKGQNHFNDSHRAAGGIQQANAPNDQADSPRSRGAAPSYGSADRRSLDRIVQSLNRGHAEAEQGRFEEAKQHYHDVLKEQSNHPAAHHRLAVIADLQEDFRIAEHHYSTALREKPHDADLLSDLGWSYILQGRFEESEEYLQRALSAQPNHQRAANRMGFLQAKRGNYDQALSWFRKGGTEAEAQAKLSRLFPDGPTESQAGAYAQQPPFERKQGDPPSGEQRQPSSAPFPTANAGANGGVQESSAEDINQQLREMMERERQRGIAARQQARQNGSSPSSGLRNEERNPVGTSTADSPFAGMPAAEASESLPIVAGPSSEPRQPPVIQPPNWADRNRSGPLYTDNQINQAFAEIDGAARNTPRGSNSHFESSTGSAGSFPAGQPSPNSAGNLRTVSEIDRRGQFPGHASGENLPGTSGNFQQAENSAEESLPVWPPTVPESPGQWADRPGIESNNRIADTRNPGRAADSFGESRNMSSTVQPAGFEQNTASVQNWPHVPGSSSADGAFSQDRAGQPPQRESIGDPSGLTARTSDNRNTGVRLDDASRHESHLAAAYLGMSAGPGGMFPLMNRSSTSAQQAQEPVVQREFPGTGSRLNGAQFTPPQRFEGNERPPTNQQFQGESYYRNGSVPANPEFSQPERSYSTSPGGTPIPNQPAPRTAYGTGAARYDDQAADFRNQTPMHPPGELSEYDVQMQRHHQSDHQLRQQLNSERSRQWDDQSRVPPSAQQYDVRSFGTQEFGDEQFAPR